MKICTKCRKELPTNKFTTKNDSPDGLYYWCKDCKSLYQRNNRRDNSEIKVLLTCIECGELTIYNKNKLYCDECFSIRFKESQKKYSSSIKGKLTLHNQRVKRRGVIHNFTYKEWMETLEPTNGYCPSCGEYVGIYNLTLDHKFPINSVPYGFVYEIGDVQPLCKGCNSSKSDKIIVEEL